MGAGLKITAPQIGEICQGAWHVRRIITLGAVFKPFKDTLMYSFMEVWPRVSTYSTMRLLRLKNLGGLF